MTTSQTQRTTMAALLCLAAGITANAQFKTVGPAPYTPAVARPKIKALLAKMDPASRQQSIAALANLLNWFRDIVDDELIAAWKNDGARQNLPDTFKTLADARVAAAVVEFSWRERREATFQLDNAPMFVDLMLRFPDSSKPFLDDLLASVDPASGQPPLELTQPEAYAVCRILLDMPDIRTWKKSALLILPRYRDIAENLLAADVNEGDRDRRTRAQYWSAELRSTAPAAPDAPSGRRIMQPATPPKAAAAPLPSLKAASGTLECTGAPIPQNGEYIFRNVQTTQRRFEFDRKIWDVRITPGDGDAQNLILKNKSSSAQKHCVVRWTAIP